ncbi:MAG TPA: glycosyltransferase family 4 protein [Anaerolineae bacterium]|nr:glycosyltransferase family 4 protein [Anaerolineae bacterium]HQI85499.1 glycosyltransferase family 4 protein [Anaerolineae bacterium]
MSHYPVLYFHSSADLYGSDQCLLRLLQYLDPEQFTPIVLLPEKGLLLDHLQALGVETIVRPLRILHRTYNPSYWLRFVFGALPSLAYCSRLVRQRGVALIHSNTSHVLDGGLVARAMGIPHVWHVREIHSTQPWIIRTFLPRFIVRHSAACIAISQATRDAFFEQASDLSKITTIYDGIEFQRFASAVTPSATYTEFALNPAAPLVGMVGRIARWKGHHIFIKAAAQVHTINPSVRFMIVGDAVTQDDIVFREELKSLVQQLHLQEHVIFTGVRHDVPVLLRAFTVFVLPSVQPEPLGNVVLEAMAAACPVIATAQGGPLETVLPGETGLLIPPADVAGLAEAMLSLLNFPELARDMGLAGQARCKQYYTIEHYVESVTTLYRSLLE